MSVAMERRNVNDIRYGFYLRPSLAMSRAQAAIYDLLARQYNLQAAGRFMPHATIKGFFRSDAPVEEIRRRLDPVMAERSPLTIHNRGPIAFGPTSIVLDIHHLPDGEVNCPLQSLHEDAIAALLPVVHPDCDFSPDEWLGPRFLAHLTLAMADLKEELAEEVGAFVREAEPIGPAEFVADTFHLFAFTSDAWSARWWETLRWEHLASWRLR